MLNNWTSTICLDLMFGYIHMISLKYMQKGDWQMYTDILILRGSKNQEPPYKIWIHMKAENPADLSSTGTASSYPAPSPSMHPPHTLPTPEGLLLSPIPHLSNAWHSRQHLSWRAPMLHQCLFSASWHWTTLGLGATNMLCSMFVTLLLPVCQWYGLRIVLWHSRNQLLPPSVDNKLLPLWKKTHVCKLLQRLDYVQCYTNPTHIEK